MDGSGIGVTGADIVRRMPTRDQPADQATCHVACTDESDPGGVVSLVVAPRVHNVSSGLGPNIAVPNRT